MPPSGPIQTLPLGFLSLLQLKNLGQNPAMLLDEVRPVVDMEPWWLRNGLIHYNGIGVNVIPIGSYYNFQGYTTPIMVPEREWWYIHRYSATLTSVGGGSICDQFRLAYAVGGAANQTFVLGDVPTPMAANGATAAGVADFWLPPGAFLGSYIGAVTGDDVRLDLLGLHYTPLTV